MKASFFSKLLSLPLCLLLFGLRAEGLSIETHVAEGVNYVSFSGDMSDQKTRNKEFVELINLDQVLNSLYSQNLPIVLLFSSEGGSREIAIPMAAQLIQFAKSWKDRTGIPLIFSVTGDCSSACTFLTAQLTSTIDPKTMLFFVPDETVFYFHAPVILHGERYTRRALDNWRAEVRSGVGQYLASGVNPDWIRRHRAFFVNSSDHPVVARDLCRNQSRIIPESSCVPDFSTIESRALTLANQLKLNMSPLGLFFRLLIP